MKVIRCVLKKGKEKPIEARHPWIFSGAIESIDEEFKTGDLIRVYSADQKFLGIGYLNPRSQIAIRMLEFSDVMIDEGFFRRRILEALEMRRLFLPPHTDACRLIHSEGDFLPGFIVDRYGEYLVAQFQTAAMDQWKPMLTKILMEETGARGIFEKDDAEMRGYEGLGPGVGRLAGEEPPDYVEITEQGIRFVVDIHHGQKTGFFLDQRDNRRHVEIHSRGRRVLNCFAYTGGFGVYAARGGATETVCVDTSEPALNTARVNYEKNGFTGDAYQFVREDVFEYLRATRQTFDLIVLDPPAFCKNKHQVQQAAKGYKDINLQAFKRLETQGLLFTDSCSSYIDEDLFQKIVFGAARDAGRNVRILAKTSQAFDHPINIYHPEGAYLKGLVCLLT